LNWSTAVAPTAKLAPTAKTAVAIVINAALIRTTIVPRFIPFSLATSVGFAPTVLRVVVPHDALTFQRASAEQ
jgi:hypothetical protein